MSRYNVSGGISVAQIRAAKGKGRRIACVTCYDAAFARLIDATTIDLVLVGDSLGNVMLGHDDTIPVTMDDMVHHTRAVSRVLEKPFLCADMPFLSYNVSVSQAVENAGRLIQEGRAQGVKLEGGKAVADKVRAVVDCGIPVMGHLGLTPQSVHAMGGYRVQGRGADNEQRLLDDARALEDAGVFALVLEMVPKGLAERVTAAVRVPTIGIGAGAGCDGQILVLHDLLGFDDGFNPKFLKKYANMGESVRQALTAYCDDVREGRFPGDEHSFKD